MEHINYTDGIQLRLSHLTFLALFAISMGHLVVIRENEGLTRIPTDINPNVTILRLASNDITRVEEGDLAGLVWLQELYMGDNQINFISPVAFINNTKLVKIYAPVHRLSEFPIGFAGAWPSIVDIDVRDGIFTKLPIQLIGFPVLERIVFTKSPIELEMGHLPSLIRLHASSCGLDTFPNLSRTPRLIMAQLHNNNFTEIPESAIMGLTNLTKLTFPGSRVRYLPDLSHLVSLEFLRADDNYIISLPDMYHLPLATITLFHNPLLCDKTLCWIRMWDSVKPGIDMSEINCGHPQKYLGATLMSIHPTDLHCYEGNVRS